MNGSILQNFPKFEPILAQIFEKIRWFGSKFGPKLGRLVHEWVTFSFFSLKIGVFMVYFQNLWQHMPTKTKLEYPSPGLRLLLKDFNLKNGIFALHSTLQTTFYDLLPTPHRTPCFLTGEQTVAFIPYFVTFCKIHISRPRPIVLQILNIVKGILPE